MVNKYVFFGGSSNLRGCYEDEGIVAVAAPFALDSSSAAKAANLISLLALFTGSTGIKENEGIAAPPPDGNPPRSAGTTVGSIPCQAWAES